MSIMSTDTHQQLPTADDTDLIEQILEATERDSVIEGLPSFTPAFREKLRKGLQEKLADEARGSNGS